MDIKSWYILLKQPEYGYNCSDMLFSKLESRDGGRKKVGTSEGDVSSFYYQMWYNEYVHIHVCAYTHEHT